MRLLEVLTTLDDHALFELRDEHLGLDSTETRSDVCLNLERELRSPNHIRSTVFNLQPPGFSLLSELLEAPNHEIAFSGLKERVTEEAAMLAARVSAGDLASGGRDHDIYRKVFVEARRSDFELDPSEVKLLAILRPALSLRTIEHFLMEHHADFHVFWKTDHVFLDVMRTLRGRGLAFVVEGNLVLPSDLVPSVRQFLGYESTVASRRRLYERLTNDDLRGSLDKAGLKLSGAKEERLQRLLDHHVQAREVLDVVALTSLRELCRDLEINVSGSKDELVERIATHFASDWDLRRPEPPPPPPPPEPRVLEGAAFDALFSSLRGEDLSDILTGIGSSRVTGAKEMRVGLLRESRFSEESLLLHLDAKQLDAILGKRRLKAGGAKRERVARIIDDARATATSSPITTIADELNPGDITGI